MKIRVMKSRGIAYTSLITKDLFDFVCVCVRESVCVFIRLVHFSYYALFFVALTFFKVCHF